MVFFISVGPVFGLLMALALGVGAAVCVWKAVARLLRGTRG